jgi:diguanylate cyclase (GGDEF)-like protein/PAS domain S-box-containing protein
MADVSRTDREITRRASGIDAAAFARRFRNYILLTWNVPPVVGLGFILFIGLLSADQIATILTTPLEPAFIIGSMVFAHFYFARYIKPVQAWLERPEPEQSAAALARMRRFPLHFWGVFLGYIVLAPTTVMVAAEIYTGYQPTPVDWFRIHLVALIVSIIVGLPIFFLILDLFGRALNGAPLARPHVTIRTKVFLIGALVPLLIDTMLVQYFWTRTGFFTGETFVMWLLLEGLAVGGTLIFVNSFGQSLAPLQAVIDKGLAAERNGLDTINAQSTDELGVLADDYRALLLARNRAEAELYREKELAQVTLASIGDGVIATDTEGRITYLNAMAEYLTGWMLAQAHGRELTDVFSIINEFTRRPVPNPVTRCLREGRIVGLANHTVLLRADGREIAIEDSAAPIRDNRGELIGVVLVFHDVTRAREMANRLSWQASHDTLTGLFNRRAFEDRLHLLLQQTENLRHSVHVMLYIDLDQFKVVNDIAGHTAGDEMLKQIAGLMQHQMRETDMLARLGGDEFGLILTDCDIGRAQRVADKIHEALEAYKFRWGDRIFRVGASIGVLEFQSGRHSLTDLLSAADLACYTAKNAGRRRTHVYAPDDVHTQQQRTEMDWATRISEAVEYDRLVLFGQRILPLNGDDGPGVHLEVLVRLRDENDNLVMPGVFLPAAERFDYMPIVDRWIITRAFSVVADCLRVCGGRGVSRCAINLSGATLGDTTLLPFIKSQLALHQLPAKLFCFEITETAAISNFTAAMNLMQFLREMGFCFALDDFGSGMSSFSYLRNLPVDFLKIDGQFVRGVAVDPVSRTLVSNINDIGHLLGKQTIAEYAEDAATLAVLRELGVDHAQGFGIHEPEPLELLLPCRSSS